jgi:uncharacterized protein (DUF2141 family)
MRTAHRLIPVAVLIALFASAPATAAELTVHLSEIRADGGVVKLALVDSQAAFDGKAPPLQATGAPPQGERASFTFKDLAPGSYAVMVTHDENGNGRMDSNMLGMPQEGYGFSNNPRVMRKPTWDEARFEVLEAGTAIDIVLR